MLFSADESSDSTLDTGSLPSTSSGDSVEWPDPFPIPQFSHDVELQLREANCRYSKDESVMVIPKSVKTDILDTLADSMAKISAYPERAHYEIVAKALVEKHPCLREPGSKQGWYSWFHSLKFKLGNYRQKLSAAGCPEVVINKRKGEGLKGKRFKKSKKGEVNYCPDPPEGQCLENMEEKREIMKAEMQKKDPDHQLLEGLMAATFSQRRKEIVGDEPPIAEVISRWPALFDERQVITTLYVMKCYFFHSPLLLILSLFSPSSSASLPPSVSSPPFYPFLSTSQTMLINVFCLSPQIRAEFQRIVAEDLLEKFFAGLDGLVPRLLAVYRPATMSGKKQSLQKLLECLEKDVS